MRLPLPRARVPQRLRANHFTLLRQDLSHNDPDYAAVMSARDHLRAWSHSEWPEDGFTLSANADDLRMHIADAERGFAYGFTVFPTDRSSVWGSVYLNPIHHYAQFYRLDPPAAETFDVALVAVDYWLLPELETDEEFHLGFILELEAWLSHEWGFTQPLFLSRPRMTNRRALLEKTGLTTVLLLDATNEPPRRLWFHGRLTEQGAFADPSAEARSV